MSGQGPISLRSVTFRGEREHVWRELEALVDRVEARGIDALSPEELHRLPTLYRAALSSLSVARAISLDRNVLAYLERLAARAHLAAYRPSYGRLATLRDAVGRVFPALLWRRRGLLALAATAMVLGGALGFGLTMADMDRYELLAGVDPDRSPATSTDDLRDILYTSPDDGLSPFAAFLWHHNGSIALGCVALGALAGIPVILLLLYNGLHLGAVVALYTSRDLGLELWLWMLPHGVTELLAIVVAGAAGLGLGRAVLFPGELKRGAALALAGRDAGALAVGAVAMLLVAALIEGYFRQLVQDLGVRALVSVAGLVFWIVYIGVLGRRRAA